MTNGAQTPGAWLKAARADAGYTTAAEFARALGVERYTVSTYETGKSKPSDETAQKIADVLRKDIISVRWHLGLWVPRVDQPAREMTLDDYTDAQLLAELTRRTEARLQPDPEEGEEGEEGEADQDIA